MNFANSDVKIEKKVLLNYIKNNNLDFNELAGLANLYKSYEFINELLEKNINQNKTLLDFENDIYTVKGKQMTEMQKIELELSRIDKKFEIFKEHMSISSIDVITDDILKLKKIFLKYSEEHDVVTLHYIKKCISVLQAKLGLKNYFFAATVDAFKERYMEIMINTNKQIKKKYEI